LFRDFGIDPKEVIAPAERVRAYLSTGHIIGQFLATLLMSGSAWNGTGSVLVLGLEGLGLAALLVAGFGYIVYRITCNDYVWVELDGERIRPNTLLRAGSSNVH